MHAPALFAILSILATASATPIYPLGGLPPTVMTSLDEIPPANPLLQSRVGQLIPPTLPDLSDLAVPIPDGAVSVPGMTPRGLRSGVTTSRLDAGIVRLSSKRRANTPLAALLVDPSDLTTDSVLDDQGDNQLSQSPTPIGQRDTTLEGRIPAGKLTNAQRIAQGLGIKAPTRRSHHRPRTSQIPLVNQVIDPLASSLGLPTPSPALSHIDIGALPSPVPTQLSRPLDGITGPFGAPLSVPQPSSSSNPQFDDGPQFGYDHTTFNTSSPISSNDSSAGSAGDREGSTPVSSSGIPEASGNQSNNRTQPTQQGALGHAIDTLGPVVGGDGVSFTPLDQLPPAVGEIAEPPTSNNSGIPLGQTPPIAHSAPSEDSRTPLNGNDVDGSHPLSLGSGTGRPLDIPGADHDTPTSIRDPFVGQHDILGDDTSPIDLSPSSTSPLNATLPLIDAFDGQREQPLYGAGGSNESPLNGSSSLPGPDASEPVAGLLGGSLIGNGPSRQQSSAIENTASPTKTPSPASGSSSSASLPSASSSSTLVFGGQNLPSQSSTPASTLAGSSASTEAHLSNQSGPNFPTPTGIAPPPSATRPLDDDDILGSFGRVPRYLAKVIEVPLDAISLSPSDLGSNGDSDGSKGKALGFVCSPGDGSDLITICLDATLATDLAGMHVDADGQIEMGILGNELITSGGKVLAGAIKQGQGPAYAPLTWTSPTSSGLKLDSSSLLQDLGLGGLLLPIKGLLEPVDDLLAGTLEMAQTTMDSATGLLDMAIPSLGDMTQGGLVMGGADDCAHTLCLTGDVKAYEAAYGNGAMQVRMRAFVDL